MQRRDFLRGALASVVLPALPFQAEKKQAQNYRRPPGAPARQAPDARVHARARFWSTGGTFDCVHFVMATPKSPWADQFIPPPGGPPEVYSRFEEDNQVTRGAEGIYVRPSDRPGFRWDIEVS